MHILSAATLKGWLDDTCTLTGAGIGPGDEMLIYRLLPASCSSPTEVSRSPNGRFKDLCCHLGLITQQADVFGGIGASTCGISPTSLSSSFHSWICPPDRVCSLLSQNCAPDQVCSLSSTRSSLCQPQAG